MVQKQKKSVREINSVPVIHLYSIPIVDDYNKRKLNGGTNYYNSTITFESKELHHSNTDSETESKNINDDDNIQRLEANIVADSDSESGSVNHTSKYDGVIFLSECVAGGIVLLPETLLPDTLLPIGNQKILK